MIKLLVEWAGDEKRTLTNTNWICSMFVEYMNRYDRVCLVGDKDGQAVGFLLGFYEPKLFEPGFHACDALVYVGKEHRTSTQGITHFVSNYLLKEFETWAREKGCDMMHISITNEERVEALELTMQRYHFEQKGLLYAKKL